MKNLIQNLSVSMLLTTKLNMPLQKPNLVIRRALIDRLIEGLQYYDTDLFLISAPAGYGKTTLVCEWINSESFHHTWISLDEKDNDPERFLTYLLAAFRKIIPEAGQTTQNLFVLPQLPPVDVLITPLINDLTELKERVIVVLDDYHMINNRYIHDIIQFILDYRPHLLHLVLITREEPPLALPRMRARGMITEIRAGDLRFSDDEAAAFMSDIMRLSLENEAITVLNLLIEGWIAGLQLAALSMQGRTPEEITGFIMDFSGNNRYIIDYLSSEVLANLPEEIRNFLHQTIVLDRLCASLCNAVTGRKDSQQLLESLKQSNLFLFPLDEESQWYRYHHLFADSLAKELSREEQQAIHQKAAHWYEAAGYVEEAVIHTISAADYQEAGRLIYLTAMEIFLTGRLMTLKSWLDALPDNFIYSSGELALCKMGLLHCTGQIEAVGPYISVFENDPQAQLPALNRGRFYVICAALANVRGDPQKGIQLAKEALDLLKNWDNDYISALNNYGLTLLTAGNLTEAIEVFREAFKLKEKQGYNLVTVYALIHLLSSLELNGRLDEAIRLGEDVVAEIIDYYGLLQPLMKLLYLPLGFSYYKANKLEQALEYLVDGIDICRKLSINGQVNGEYTLARVYGAFGDFEKALTTIGKAVREIDPVVQPLAAFDNTALEAEILLRRGEMKAAIDWAEFWQLAPSDKPTLLKEQSYFTFVRLLLAQERFQEALDLLQYLESSTQVGQRYSRLITVHLLQTLAYNLSGNGPRALQYLSQAIKLAAPGGYYRPFLDEGLLIAEMLPKVQVVEPKFVAQLLKAFTKTAIKFDNLGAAFDACLIEPLSCRETELLHLVAVGLSNEEISRKIGISINTTKWHIYNIFQKLRVNSRTQAVAKAKELDLI
jgi:LuxR family maltose regulon positive regulatory protein